LLRPRVQRLPLLIVRRCRRLLDQLIDFAVTVEDAIEADRRHLLRVIDPSQHVGIGHADPLQGIHLEVAARDIGEERLQFA
jgi:hypothetical protein